jgi:hypothetical protein
MAQQAMNFLFDDDMVKDSDDIKLSGKDAGNGKKVSNFAFINASNYYNALKDDKGNFGLHRVHESEKLKAGHIMSCSGHILIVIDVDVFEKHVEFTTLESTSEGNGADESTGGGQQVRWAVPKGKGFEGKIQYLKPDGTWGVPGSKSRKEAVYGYQIKVEQKLGRA